MALSRKLNPLFNLLVIVALPIAALLLRHYPEKASQVTAQDQYIFMLQTCDVWNQEGLVHHHFSPVITYTNPGDKFVDVYPRLVSKTGDNYYVSYPPMAFWTVYAFLKVFHLPIDSHSLQVFGLLMFVACALFIFLIAHHFQSLSFNQFSWFSVQAVLIYAAVPSVVHLHMNVVFPEMIVHLPWLALFFVLLKWYSKPQISTWQWILLFFLSYCCVMTEWLGLFVILTGAVVFLFAKGKRSWALVMILAILLAATTTLSCYATINGVHNMYEALHDRAVKRSGMFSQPDSEQGLNVKSHGLYNMLYSTGIKSIGYIYFLYLATLIGGLFLFRKAKSLMLIVLFAVLPVLIHNILFLNFTSLHFHGLSKNAVPIALLITFITICVYQKFPKIAWSIFALSILISLQSLIFGVHTDMKTADDHTIQLAKEIQQKAFPEAALYVNLSKATDYSPTLTLLTMGLITKRQIGYAEDTVDALHRDAGRHRPIVYFETDNQLNLVKADTLRGNQKSF